MSDASTCDDPFDLKRFLEAQRPVYAAVLAELGAGRKRTHWMWFIFPQIDGLGSSTMAVRYAIAGLDEAKSYLAHPVLGARLKECTELLLQIPGRSIDEILGFPDNLKLKSSMTLFAQASDPWSVFTDVLDRFYGGTQDEKTLAILAG
jgi:uncharacterized protein (DUF1810 family)